MILPPTQDTGKASGKLDLNGDVAARAQSKHFLLALQCSKPNGLSKLFLNSRIIHLLCAAIKHRSGLHQPGQIEGPPNSVSVLAQTLGRPHEGRWADQRSSRCSD